MFSIINIHKYIHSILHQETEKRSGHVLLVRIKKRSYKHILGNVYMFFYIRINFLERNLHK